MSIVRLKNKKNGITYVYESSGYWDREKRQARNIRTCIGKINPETGDIIYNRRYLEQEQQTKDKKRGHVPSLEYRRYFYGATYLLDRIGKKLGIAEDLETCFKDRYKQILSIAYYLILEDRNPMSRFEKWARTHRHPCGKLIPSQRSSELFASIREDVKQRFFALQSKRRLETEYLVYDTTSISSYSQMIKQVKYGLNKDHDHLAQINLALLMGQSSRLPVVYRKLAGNIADVTTIKKLLSDLKYLNIKKVKLVMDRGFYSEDNINALYAHHYKFLMTVKNSMKPVRGKLDSARDSMITYANYSAAHKLYCRSFTTDWNYTHTKSRSGKKDKEKRRLYLHIYYNDQRATDDKSRFNKQLGLFEEELRTGNKDPKHEKLYEKYFSVTKTPVRGIRITPKEDIIRKKEKSFGYFALIGNDIKDGVEAINIYRSKDVIEKAYDDLKNRLNLRRASVSSEENLEGKLFVQFVALIYLSYIKQRMDKKGLFKRYTLQGLLDELDIIECFTQPGKQPVVGEVTHKQRELFKAMEVEGIS